MIYVNITYELILRCVYVFVVSLHISTDLGYSLILSFIALLIFFVTSDNKKHWAVWPECG